MPPSIPTSFIPHPAGAPVQRYKGEFVGALAFISYIILAAILAGEVGVFIYGRVLAGQLATKDADLTKAEKAIDPASVQNFVRLRDRLNSGQTLLSGHDAFSGFFTAVESILPSTVRFTSLHLTINQNGAVVLQGAGTAKSFNALAAASAAFSTDGRIKDAIFSGITVNKDTTVSFTLAASLDPKLVAFSASTVAPTTATSTTQSAAPPPAPPAGVTPPAPVTPATPKATTPAKTVTPPATSGSGSSGSPVAPPIPPHP